MECIRPSYTIANILKEHGGDLRNFFRKYNADESGPYGIKAEVIDTFVRSCGSLLRFVKF